MTRFKIKLQKPHEQTGYSYYRVAKESGVALNTVKKYASVTEIISEYLPVAVIMLCDFYGVDWRDPEIVEVIEEEPEDEYDPFVLATA